MQPLVEPGTSHTRPKQVSYRPARSSLGCTLRVLIQVQTLCTTNTSHPTFAHAGTGAPGGLPSMGSHRVGHD